MKYIIALRGVRDMGKSATLKEFRKQLKEHYGAAATEEPQRHNNEGADIQLLIRIGGKLIGIESQGDPGYRLPKTLQLFVEVGCHIIFCATRTKGGTYDAVNALQDHGYQVEWVTQIHAEGKDNQEASNARQASLLLDKLKALLAQCS